MSDRESLQSRVPACVDRPGAGARILFVEDDPLLADGLSHSLRHAGFIVDWVDSGLLADSFLAERPYDLAILDLGLPGLDGAEVLQRLRQRGQVLPALILSARDAHDERVRLLDQGVDDYLVKPVAFDELEAHIRALIRHGGDQCEGRVQIGVLALDRPGRCASVNGLPLALSGQEWVALEFLASHANRIVGMQEMIDALGDETSGILPLGVDTLILQLRAKLELAGVRLRTVRGLGFYLELPLNTRGH